MFSSAEKSKNTTVQRQQQPPQTFFRKAGEESFFGAKESSSFFSSPLQAKLTVSSPDDPQEREADAVADRVMRMPESAPAIPQQEEEKIQKKEEEENEDRVQAKLNAPEISVQRKCAECEKDEEVSAKLYNAVSRMQDEDRGEEEAIQTKRISANTLIMRSERGPPANSSNTSFEQSLSSSKGAGTAMSQSTQQFMGSRFGADFSGVRIHTGGYAEDMSSSINAQAFTHGNDIYFNAGKYAPHTEAGGTLLAHELTHTIQQGATAANSGAVSAKHISTKIIQRRPSGVPPQLSNAVEKAKTVEGKIDANKPQADGNRTGWEHLIDIFKTTFGEEMIVGNGSAQQGAVAEQDIKKKRMQTGVMVVDKTTVTDRNAISKTTTGSRDAMPSWCGIFVFWALNKSGVPMPKWKLGRNMIKPKAARIAGDVPQPGDIAYRNAYSHFAIVEAVNGNTVKTVNGNTAGADNLGGQVQTIEHPLSDWTAFFNPLIIMDGSLGNGESAPAEEEPKTLEEMQQQLFNVNRKGTEVDDGHAKNAIGHNTTTQFSNWSVSSNGTLHRDKTQDDEKEKLQLKEEEKQEEENGLAQRKILINKKQEIGETNANNSANDPVNDTSVIQSKNDVNNYRFNIQGAAGHVQSKPQAVAARGPPVLQGIVNRNMIQRSWLGDAWDAVSGVVSEAAAYVERGLNAAKEWLLEKVRDFVSNIPGYRMLCLVLGHDPITGAAAPLTGASLLEAGLDLLPAGGMFRSLLNRLGIFNDVAAWLLGRVDDVSALATGIAGRFGRFWNGLSLDDAADPEGVINRVAYLLRGTINDIVHFAERSATTFLAMIKRVMIREIAAFVRRRIPRIFPLLTVALGFNPETMEDVARNGTNILYALLEVSEEGQEQRRQMMATGTFQRIAAWVDRSISVFSRAYHMLMAAFRGIWNFVTIENLFHPIATFDQIFAQFSAPIVLVGRFLIDAGREILRVIKDALLGRLSAYARQTRGFSLICVIIGRDPFTGQRVPRTVHNVVKGFMSLMDGGEQQCEQLNESGAIDRIVNKVEAAVTRLNMTPQAIIQMFYNLWHNVFTLQTLRDPIGAFSRIVQTFGAPIARLVRFVIEIVMIVVEAILILMSFPFDLVQNILAKARLAFESIRRDPVGFFKNLLRGIKQGFVQFFNNILTHLLNGLTGWLLSELRDANVPQPQDFSLRGIIGWVLEVLGISMEAIWQKLAQHPRIGPERVARLRAMIDRVEGIWTFIRDVQQRGIAAIWERIQERLSNLWETILDAVKNWVMERVVNQVTARLLSMLDPTGIMAVVNSAIAIYRAIQSFIRYMRQMLEVVNTFVNGVADVAAGNISVAANYLENAMDRAMPVVIGFLANQVGLSGIGRRVADMLTRVRELVDQALTWLVNRAVDTGMNLLDRVMAMGRSVVSSVSGWLRRILGIEKSFTADDGSNHRLYFAERGTDLELMMNPRPAIAYEVWVRNIIIDTTSPAGQQRERKKNQAIAKAREIDALKSSTASEVSDEEQKSARLRILMDELSTLTGALFAGQRPACSTEGNGLNYSTVYNGLYGSAMEINELTNYRQPAGSVPGVSHHSSYAILNQRRNEGGSYYVLGHLLNHNLGGTGRDWKNLTPLTREANRAHEHIAEARVKNAVNAGNIVKYKVRAEYGRGRMTSSNATINEIKSAEINVPRRLVCEAEMITPSDMSGNNREMRSWLVPAGTIIDNTIEQNDSSYDLTGIRHAIVYLNSGDIDAISGIAGVDRRLAQKIIDAWRDRMGRPERLRFPSYDGLANYVFMDGRTFTPIQKTIINTMPDYVRLYQN